ncbi:MAG: acetoacetate decarboxylase family protein [Rhodospirillaceae bacterium]|jgi:acetoacetate decarboxylase|nr:acetoacetate decarboxylase family protein [Rhodospirillaceae bacterium]
MDEAKAGSEQGYRVQSGNNMPIQAPLIPDPFVPYHCPHNANLMVVCRTDKAVLEKYLAPTPFEAIDDRYVVYASDFSRCDKTPFMDTGIIVPVRWGKRTGGYFLFEYENNDSAIAAGRDLWGYPKKYAEILFEESEAAVRSRTVRKGETIMELRCNLTRPAEFEPVVTTPHLNIHIQPGPDGRILNKRIIERDTSPDFALESECKAMAEVSLRGLSSDPLHELQPQEVLGASFVVGHFHATEENGWGRTVVEL